MAADIVERARAKRVALFDAASGVRSRSKIATAFEGTPEIIDGLIGEIESLRAERDALKAAISSPEAVRVNILRGTIVVPDDLVWLHDTNGPVAALRARVGELEADKRRLDWLETMTVNVRQPLVYGSHDRFWANPDDSHEGEIGPSDIRKQIDAALANPEPPHVVI